MPFSELREGDPRRLGPYRLLQRIGAGGMGVVYLAVGVDDDVVAIKVVRDEFAEDPRFRDRFRREVDAARRVGGTCTARLRDVDTEGERPWLVTDFVPGPNLAELVERHGCLDHSGQRALAAGLVEALGAVHGAAVLHRDLKPQNVLCSPSGPRLIDFGVAWAAEETRATRTGQIVGSPSWMAPEQIRGGEVDFRTDLFALGAVISFAATGRAPFGTGAVEAVMYRLLNDAPDLGEPGQIDPALEPLVRALLCKDPAGRPALAALASALGTPSPIEVTRLLERTWVLPAGETLAVPYATDEPPREPGENARPRRRLALRLAGAAALAVVALVAVLLSPGPASHHRAPLAAAVSPTTAKASAVSSVDSVTAASTTTTASTFSPNTSVPVITTSPPPTPATTTPPAPVTTSLKVFGPWAADGSLASDVPVTGKTNGSCWTSSIALSWDANAYRCMAGNEIYDPCFASAASTHEVACANSPWSGIELMTLTAPLPSGNGAGTGGGQGGLWAVQLASGDRCVVGTGTGTEVGGQGLPYVCASGGFAGGVDQQHQPWTVEYAKSDSSGVLVTETVAVAWK